MEGMKKLYVQADEICEDWGVSRSQAYKMIQELNRKMLQENPNLIVLAGKANRKYYERCCGMAE
jgi:hypothetical protein